MSQDHVHMYLTVESAEGAERVGADEGDRDSVRAELIAALQVETDPGVRVALQTALTWLNAQRRR